MFSMHAWSSAGLVKISICCFSAKNAVLRSKRTDWLVWNQDNVFEWRDMSIHGLLLVEHDKNPIQHIDWSSTKGETIHRMYRNHDYFGDGSVHDTWRPLTIQTI
jgi:hypothetical protein